MKAQINKGTEHEDVGARGIYVTTDNGAQWVVRANALHPNRLDVMLVPGTGPNGEDYLSVRPQANNVITVEAER